MKNLLLNLLMDLFTKNFFNNKIYNMNFFDKMDNQTNY